MAYQAALSAVAALTGGQQGLLLRPAGCDDTLPVPFPVRAMRADVLILLMSGPGVVDTSMRTDVKGAAEGCSAVLERVEQAAMWAQQPAVSRADIVNEAATFWAADTLRYTGQGSC